MSIFFTNFISQWGKLSFYEFVYPITQGGVWLLVTCMVYGVLGFIIVFSMDLAS
jgi:hypothetical protein